MRINKPIICQNTDLRISKHSKSIQQTLPLIKEIRPTLMHHRPIYFTICDLRKITEAIEILGGKLISGRIKLSRGTVHLTVVKLEPSIAEHNHLIHNVSIQSAAQPCLNALIARYLTATSEPH